MYVLGAQKNRIIDVCIHNYTSVPMRDQTVFTIVCVINYKAIFGMGMVKSRILGVCLIFFVQTEGAGAEPV